VAKQAHEEAIEKFAQEAIEHATPDGWLVLEFNLNCTMLHKVEI
jgi:hypothetical protein